jgi:uncharacterized protein (DUF1330 family)
MTVQLFGNEGESAGLRAYEKKALAIFKRYGGEVVVAYVPANMGGERELTGETPDEIQVLRIPDRTGFDAFLNDPERMRMAEERARVIRKTEVFLSGDLIDY